MNAYKRIRQTAAFQWAADLHEAFWSHQSFDGTVTIPLTPAQFINQQRSKRKLPRCTTRLGLGWTLPYYRAVIKGEIDDIPF
jgi:hypothetical protein